MKKLKLVLVFSLLVFLSSCNKDQAETGIEVNSEERFQELQAESQFLEFEKLQGQLTEEMFTILEENNIAPNELYNFYKEGNSEKINKLFEDERILKIRDELAPIMSFIKTQYGDIITVPDTHDYEKTIEIGLKSLQDINTYSDAKRRGCSWRYTLCGVAATTAYTACMAVAGTATGGLAALACTTAYLYAMTECHRKHCS